MKKSVLPNLFKRVALTFPAMVAGCFFSGCVSSKEGAIAQSLESVSGGYEHQGAWKVEQIRGTSINGLMPFQGIGEVFHYKPARGALGAFGISENGKTSVVTRKFLYDGAKGDDAAATQVIADITRNLRLLAANGAEAVVKKIDLATLKSELTQKENSLAGADAAKRAEIEAEVTRAKGQVDALETTIAKLEDQKTRAEAELNQALGKPNVIIARWATDEKQSAGVQAGTLAGGSGSRGDRFRGFVILVGFQVQNIVIGEDLIKALRDQTANIELGRDYTDWIGTNIGSRVHVVTSLLKADHIAYLGERDLVSEMKLHLRIKASEMQNGAAWLKNLDQIAVDYAATLGQSYSNSGYIRQTGKTETRTLAEDRLLRGQDSTNQCTVMSVTTEVRDLFKIYK